MQSGYYFSTKDCREANYDEYAASYDAIHNNAYQLWMFLMGQLSKNKSITTNATELEQYLSVGDHPLYSWIRQLRDLGFLIPTRKGEYLFVICPEEHLSNYKQLQAKMFIKDTIPQEKKLSLDDGTQLFFKETLSENQ